MFYLTCLLLLMLKYDGVTIFVEKHKMAYTFNPFCGGINACAVLAFFISPGSTSRVFARLNLHRSIDLNNMH